MKKLMKTSLLAFSVLSLFACGKFQQDPFAQKDNSVLRGQTPDDPSQAAKPLPSDAVVIESLSVLSFKEFREDEYEIRHRVNAPGYESTIQILNLEDFPGAIFDTETSKLKWTPQPGVVVGEDFREMRLRIQAFGQPSLPGDPVLFSEKTITVLVAKEPTVPEILAIVNQPSRMREGEASVFEIRFRDMDATTDAKMQSDIEFMPAIGTFNLGHFARVDSISPLQTPGEFQARIRVDLTRIELTKSSFDASLNFQIRSRLNRRSAAQSFNIKVFNKTSSAITTWTTFEEFVPLVQKIHFFQIVDPKLEGRLTFVEAKQIPAGASLKCDQAGDSLLLCSLRWTPNAVQSDRNFEMLISTRMQNSDPLDTGVQNQTFKYRIRTPPLAEPPAPSPSPEPTPVPEPGPIVTSQLKGGQ